MPITVNGVAAELPSDPRVSLLDLLRDHLHLPGTKKGCDQGAAAPAPCWSTASASCPAWRWRCSTTGARSPRSRGWRRTARCIRCKRRSSSMTGSSAAIARPDRSVRRWAWRAELRRGVPSHVTADLARSGDIAQRDEIARADERQSVPLRRAITASSMRSVATCRGWLSAVTAVHLCPCERRSRSAAPDGGRAPAPSISAAAPISST